MLQPRMRCQWSELVLLIEDLSLRTVVCSAVNSSLAAKGAEIFAEVATLCNLFHENESIHNE